MAKVKFLNNDNLSSFVENTVDTAMKIAEKTKFFDDEGIVSTLPWGKFISYFAKKIIVIEDRNEAFQKAIAFTYFKTFCQALLKYKIDLSVDDNYLHLFKKSYVTDFKVEDFKIEDFNENDIIKIYKKSYNQLLINDTIEENTIIKVNKYINDYLKLNFFEILDQQKLSFKVLNEFFDSKSYIEYQEKFLIERYNVNLRNEFTQVVLNDDKGMTLEDIYTEPDFRIHLSCLNDKDIQESINSKRLFINIKNKSSQLYNLTLDFLHAKNSYNLKLENPNLMLILGYPGQGKSTFCKKLVHDILNGHSPIEKEIYLIKLRAIMDVKDLVNNPLEAIKEYLQEIIEIELKLNKIKKSVLVLDGLDELYMKDGLNMADIDYFINELVRRIEVNNDIKIIITTRYGYVDLDKITKKNILIVQLEEFDEQKEINWLTKYKVFHPEILFNVDKIKEINKIYSLRHLKELINQPILLHMVATADIQIESNANRALIYEKLFTTLIERNWTKEGQIENLKSLEKDDLRDLIAEIALAIFHKGKGYITKKELLELESVNNLNKILGPKVLADCLKLTMIAFYFQEVKKKDNDTSEDKNNYAIEFLHKSLQEYMASEKIWKAFTIFIEKYQSSHKKYILDSWIDALKVISKVFSPVLLSKEVVLYLKDIIKNQNLINTEELSHRLEYFLPEFLDSNFLYSYNLNDKVSPIELSLNTFYGYWTVISNLNVNRNFITENIKHKFAFMLLCLSKRGNIELDLSFQILRGVNLIGLSCDNLKLVNSDLKDAELSHSYSQDVSLENCILDGANLNKSSLLRDYLHPERKIVVRINNSDIGSIGSGFSLKKKLDINSISLIGAALPTTLLYFATLVNKNLSYINFTKSVFRNVNFNGSDLSNCIFLNCCFINVTFKNTKLDNTDFQNAKFFNVNGLKYEQLSKVATLFQVEGLNSKIESRLQKEIPKLFEDPDPLPF